MNRLCLITTALLLSFFCTASPAQIVPLVLEETVTLPVENTLWSVIPHSGGFYYFVQAAEIQSGITTIYVGRTDQTGITELDINGTHPFALGAMYVEDTEFPCMLLANLLSEDGPLLIRLIDLADLRTDDSLTFAGYSYDGWPIDEIVRDFMIAAADPFPAPPEITSRLSLAVSYSYYSHYTYFSFTSDAHSRPLIIYPDLIGSPDTFYGNSIPYGNPGSFQGNVVSMSSRETGLFVCSSWSRYDSYSTNGNGSSDYSCGVALKGIVSDTVRTYYSDSQVHNPPDFCSPGNVVCSYSESDDHPLMAARVRGVLIGLFPDDSGYANWTVPEYYSMLFAADAAENDGREEILGYRADLENLHVYRWSDGWPYGRTSDITPNPDRIAVVGRFSDEYRRLALQYGDQIFLYSFGDYLAVDPDRPDPLRNETIRLTSSPQPARDLVQFNLSEPLAKDATLKVYNILGREVYSGLLTAHAATLSLNLFHLPSGVYFAHLDRLPSIPAHKFVLLR